MESHWAAEHLQVIRTLMERSALYRRALAPIMLYNGIIGSTAAGLGILRNISSPTRFILFWVTVAVVAFAGSLWLVRRQALKDSEPFWSPPTRRIMQAMLPLHVAGLVLGLVVLSALPKAPAELADVIALLWLPFGWVILYGGAFHAAGFFMPRGMRLFGWLFVLGGCAGFAMGRPGSVSQAAYAHGIMGFFFGVLHLAYGVYLYFTERKNES